MIYLDNPATSLKKPLPVMLSLFKNSLFNSVNAGRGSHRYSLKGADIISDAQDSLAPMFKIKYPERIAFTQNATLALNMAIHGVLDGGGHVIVTSMEHNSVLRPVNMLGNYTVVCAGRDGIVKVEDIEAAIRDDTVMIICTHASNVCGSIQPIEEIGRVAKEHGLVFLVDAAQTAGIVDIDVNRMNIDILVFSGHKGLMGPLGTGGLYVRENVSLTPYITGGTGSMSESLIQPDFMPDKLHSGTVNTPAVAALGKAAEFVISEGTENILEHERRLAGDFIERIKIVDGVKVLGTDDMSKRNGTVAFVIDGIDSGEAANTLGDEFKIAARGGWHCAYLAHKTLGTQAQGAVRVGFGYYNTLLDSVIAARSVSVIAQRVKKK